MANHNNIGQKGEEIAVGFLQDKGYKILERNWRFKKHEIDIIALKNDLLIVLEVKTRTGQLPDNISEIVKFQKQRSIIMAANAFVESKALKHEVRFDIIVIGIKGNNYHLQHLIEAFTTVG
jgi:putative endonuclease